MPPSFITEPIFPGLQGVDLKKAIDQVESTRLVRMTNLMRPQEGELTGRPGLTTFLTLPVTGSVTKAFRRLAIPEHLGISGDFDYFTLVDGSLYASIDAGTSTLIEDGFGNDTTLSVYHPVNNAGPWLVLTDHQKARKVQVGTHFITPLGLPIPYPFGALRFRIDEFSSTPDGSMGSLDRARFAQFGFAVTESSGGGETSSFTSYGPQNINTIDECDNATGWVPNAGTGGVPAVVVDNSDYKSGTGSIKFTSENGGAVTRYYNFWVKQNSVNLNSVAGVAATDDDIIHLWLKTDRPDKVEEIRLYFVIDDTCDTATLPGTSATVNQQAYVKSFRPSDFSGVLVGTTATATAATSAASGITTKTQLKGKKDKRGGTKLQQAQLEESRWSAFDMMLGSAWQEIGVIGYPLKRGEFRRIGGDTERDWSNVSGVVVAVQMSDSTEGVNVWIDNLYLTGGAGLDTSALGMTPYDYRITNYDPRTGAESNGSIEQPAGYRLDSLRRSIVVTPRPYGDSAVRQKVYRRGGSLVNNWYFVGTNNSDGGAYTDVLSDQEILNQGTLQIDNDQPVTTQDSIGDLVYKQDLGAIFGPLADLMFGCGDPYRPGYLYWSKPGNIDAWPSTFFVEVCSSSEELMQGCVLAGNGYVFSRERMYAVVPNLNNVSQVGAVPTSCAHGLVARSGVIVAYGAIWFVSEDGIYRTVGAAEDTISDNLIRPLFHGEVRNGYYPIDFDHPEHISLEAHDNEIWFTFMDTQGVFQTWIYAIIYNYWRHYSFTPQATTFHSDQTGQLELFVGGRNTAKVFTHTGTSDDGTAIAARGTSPSLDQGQPRQDKLYGDIPVDIDRQGNSVTITPYFGNESSSGTPTVISSGTGRDRYYAITDETQAQNCAVDFQWSTTGTPPVLYRLGLSVSPQTDTSTYRVTDWESGGRLSDKYVKGILIECDTGGQDKEIQLLADGVLQATITVNANGRQVVEKSFTQFLGRLLRIKPTTTTEWKLYSYNWIFDQEPLSLTRWETQPLTHGMLCDHSLLYSHIMIKSSADVTLTLTGYRQDATTFSDTYTITSTAGVPIKRFVPFSPRKAVAWKYVFTCDSAFWLYREETEVMVQPWTGSPNVAKPFGSDDLDLTRSLNDAAFIADKSGWNLPDSTSAAPRGPQGEQ